MYLGNVFILMAILYVAIINAQALRESDERFNK